MELQGEFKIEKSWQYELGFLKDLIWDLSLRGSVYYTDIEDYQQHNYISAAYSAIIYNIDVETYGLELELTKRLTDRLGGYINYGWQDWNAEKFPLETEFTHYHMQNTPEHKATLGFNYKLWEDGMVTLNARYVGARENKREVKIEDFITVNVGAEHTFKLKGSMFTLKGYVNNVTDEEYEQRYGYPMPGIHGGISASWSF